MRQHLTLIALAVLAGCGGRPQTRSPAAAARAVAASRPRELAKTEFAMLPGQVVTATTSLGTIRVRADDWLVRSYTWDGATRSETLDPRDERWYGSLGMTGPGYGRHWAENHGITRGVVEEGQQHFDSVEAAMAWMVKPDQQWMPHVYRNDGLMVGWRRVLDREQLNVNVWQIMIGGKKPTTLPGATDAAITVVP